MATKKTTPKSDAPAPGKKSKRAYTMSPAARAQRRAAAVKTGQHAALPGGVAPCKSSTCPGEYPCQVKAAATSNGQSLSTCLPAIVGDSALAGKFLAAMQGDLGQVRALAAASLALQQQLHDKAGQELLAEGFAIRQRYQTPDGVELEKVIPHPAARPFLGLTAQLGYAAEHWLLTPKARGEEAAQKSLVDLAAFMASTRRGMGGEDA